MAKPSCPACFLFKVLFLLHPQMIWHLKCCFFVPCKEMEQILLLRSDASEPQHSSALIQKNGRREGGEKGAKREEKNQKKHNVSDLEHKMLLLKALVKPGVFWWDTETLLSLQIIPSGWAVCWSGKCHFPLTAHDILQRTQIALGDYIYVCVYVYLKGIQLC